MRRILLFDGFLGVASAGNYSFILNSDDGSLLFINGSLVVNNGSADSAQISSGSASLSAGIYPF